MLHQHLHTTNLGTSAGTGERMSAAAQSSAVYAFIHLGVSVAVFALGIFLDDLQNGTVSLPPWLAGTLVVITVLLNYLIVWGKHYLQTGDWTPPIFPTEQPTGGHLHVASTVNATAISTLAGTALMTAAPAPPAPPPSTDGESRRRPVPQAPAPPPPPGQGASHA